MFTAALCTTDKRWKQLKCPLMDEWINQLWHVYTMEYYSALKTKGIPACATVWMNLEDITLSEISSHKTTVQFHLYDVFRVVKFNDRKQNDGGWG